MEATFDNNLSFQTFARSYTDRIQSNRRYDEIQIGASYPFLFTPTTTIGIGVAGSAGVVLSGNLGLQTIQNWFHTLIGRDLVTLTYDENQFWVHPYLALKTQAAYLGSNTLAGIELGTSYAHQWELLFEANAFIAYHGFLTIRLGYVEKYVEDLYRAKASKSSVMKVSGSPMSTTAACCSHPSSPFWIREHLTDRIVSTYSPSSC